MLFVEGVLLLMSDFFSTAMIFSSPQSSFIDVPYDRL
jgi:hypothetical protein